MSGIRCELCGSMEHHIETHLKQDHPETSIAEYQEMFPGKPIMSREFKLAKEKRAKEAMANPVTTQMVTKIIPTIPKEMVEKVKLHEAFELPLNEDTRRPPKRGETEGAPIEIDSNIGLKEGDLEAVPEIDEGYVFRIDELKDITMALQLDIPLLLHGLHGAGKTTVIEQVCARLNKPWLRVQHTETTEEAHITGQMVVRNGATEFDYGPLAEAMMRGWVYVADEYDFAHPSVIAVYQAVLEGKPLYIKEAPPEQRLIKPHPMFRFVATGNTNGSGDETGLYSGTKIGNAAAYSRFGITIKIEYPEPEVEMNILTSRIGVKKEIAEKMVDFATRIRKMYEEGDISLPISPRELIRATTLGAIKGGMFRKGIDLAYANRLDDVEKEAVSGTAQRIFG